ncbi:MAG: carboxymuconolactone decarboxylase family protein [Firmicutes bacterium]|nr:carboxymuconolactone decarboxylase family protein [Bacillota bacterium]
MMSLEAVAYKAGISRSLLELVKVRVSQMNGCGYCLDMHTKDARRQGESEQRLYALAAWRETPFFTQSERALLAWAEAVTDLTRRVPDEDYDNLRNYYTEREVEALTSAVIAINAWNRWAISMRTVPGSYRPDLAR